MVNEFVSNWQTGLESEIALDPEIAVAVAEDVEEDVETTIADVDQTALIELDSPWRSRTCPAVSVGLN